MTTIAEAMNAETDECGRTVIHIGGRCPVCGNGPDVKYAETGNLVLYHLPVACQAHFRSKPDVVKPPVPYAEDE